MATNRTKRAAVRLKVRIKEYEALPANVKPGYKKPGSLSGRK